MTSLFRFALVMILNATMYQGLLASPIHGAVLEDNRERLIELLEPAVYDEEFYDVNGTDEQGLTPLHVAITRGRSECLELLLRAGADPIFLFLTELFL